MGFLNIGRTEEEYDRDYEKFGYYKEEIRRLEGKIKELEEELRLGKEGRNEKKVD